MKVLYRRARLDAARKAQIARDYNAGIAIATLLRTYGIGRSTLYKLLREVAQRAA